VINLPKVPDAAITPVKASGEYPFRNIVGRASRPIVTQSRQQFLSKRQENAPTTTIAYGKGQQATANTAAIRVSKIVSNLWNARA